jgi:hypothetical protein
MKQGNVKGHGKGKGIVEQTQGEDDISCTIELQLEKEIYRADWYTKGKQEQEYFGPESSPAVSIFSTDDYDFTEESDSKDDSEQDSAVDMCMQDDVDAPDSIDFDGNVEIERDSDDEEAGHEEEEDEKEEEEEEDEDDGKEPRTIGQGEEVNTSTDDVDTMVDDQPHVLPDQHPMVCKHTPRPQPLASTPRPQTSESCTRL